MINGLVIEYIGTNSLNMFFDFLNEYVFIYRGAIKEVIIDIVSALVKRTCDEQTKCLETGAKSNYVINQSWNILRSI